MIIDILVGCPGSRKTLTLLTGMLNRAAPHLLAAPRNALLDEHVEYLRGQAKARGITLHIEAIHSDQPHPRGNVARRIEKALKAQTGSSHAIIAISHVALLDLDPHLLNGWHVGVDENLDGSVVSGSFRASTSWSALDQHYRLDGLSDDQTSEVVPREDIPRLTRREITGDAVKPLMTFHAIASSPRRTVFVDVKDWREAQVAGCEVCWWSIWTPMTLSGCASVTFTGAGYFESLPHHAVRRLHGSAITFNRIDLGAGLRRACPRVRVHYYTAGHVGSTPWWETDEGNWCLVQVSKHQEAIGGPGYWSCNEDIRSVFRNRFPGVWCPPKQAGSNRLIEFTSCMMIYSNKPQTGDEALLNLLDLDWDVIRRAREFEDVRQFVMRGALRRPEFDGTYDIYVYDLTQADDLEAYLKANGITDVMKVPVHEAGIMNVGRPAPKPKRTALTKQQRQARNTVGKKAKRERERAEDEANGIVRNGPGRPTGSRSKSVRLRTSTTRTEGSDSTDPHLIPSPASPPTTPLLPPPALPTPSPALATAQAPPPP